jgi:hypothetical protein
VTNIILLVKSLHQPLVSLVTVLCISVHNLQGRKIEGELLGSMEQRDSFVNEDAFESVVSEWWELLDNYNCSKNVIIFVRC